MEPLSQHLNAKNLPNAVEVPESSSTALLTRSMSDEERDNRLAYRLKVAKIVMKTVSLVNMPSLTPHELEDRSRDWMEMLYGSVPKVIFS
jgi:hypothetical protein